MLHTIRRADVDAALSPLAVAARIGGAVKTIDEKIKKPNDIFARCKKDYRYRCCTRLARALSLSLVLALTLAMAWPMCIAWLSGFLDCRFECLDSGVSYDRPPAHVWTNASCRTV